MGSGCDLEKPFDQTETGLLSFLAHHFISNGIPVFFEISSKSSTTGLINGIPFLLLIASAARSGSPGIKDRKGRKGVGSLFTFASDDRGHSGLPAQSSLQILKKIL